MAYRRRRFGGPRRAASTPVMQSTGVQAKRKSKCAGCGQPINVGEQFTRLRLRKRYAIPCGTCSHMPKRAKRFHMQCVPADVNKAMGFDPTKHQAPPSDPYARPSGAVPPPPKPKTAFDTTLEAMVMLEAALVAQVRERKKPMTPELDNAFKQFQNIKQRILRPGTPGEGEAALNVGLQKLVKLVLS